MFKKLTMVLISAVFMSAVLAGCGNGNTTTPATPAAPQEAAPPVESRSVVQQFLEDYGDDIRAEFGEIAAFLGDGASIDVVAGTGEEMIFIFTYGPDAETEGLAEVLEQLMPLLEPVFEEVAYELMNELGVDSLTVSVQYREYDGTIITEQSFVA